MVPITQYPFNYTKLPGELKGVKRKKFIQQTKIIKNLYVNGPASNAEIGKRLKISIPTSLKILNELLVNEVVEEKGVGVSRGGRRPVLYGLKDNSIYALGIDMARYKTSMALYNNNNINVSGTKVFPFDITVAGKSVDQLHLHAMELIKSSGIDQKRLVGVGIIMPGLVDSVKGVNYTHMNFGTRTTRQVLEEKFNRPVYVENDAKALAHAELRYGKAKGRKNVLVIFLDWGLGLGIIIDGKIYRGALGFAGELSHTPAIDNQIYCQCGKQGCLETIASGAAIARMAREGIRSGQSSILSELVDDIDKIETTAVIDAANRGDLCSIRILSEIGMNLGKGLASLMQLLNPEMVILSGKVSEARQYITTPVQQALHTYCMLQMRENTEIVISDMGQEHGILGAVSMVMEYVFDRPAAEEEKPVRIKYAERHAGIINS